MKIALRVDHRGLLHMLGGIWRHHDVRVISGYDYLPSAQGDEDVIVTTLPYPDLVEHRGDKPVIAYMTDPLFPDVSEIVKVIWDEPWFFPVGCEPCFHHTHIPQLTEYIPYAFQVDDFPPYAGNIPKVLVVNRRPDDRIAWCNRSLGLESCTLAGYLEGIPYTWPQEPDLARFRKVYSTHRVLFHFSPSPYTLVMFEAMTVGIPIIALDGHISGPEDPLEKYLLGRHFADREVIRGKLKELLDSPPQRVDYHRLPDMGVVRQQWDALFDRCMQQREARE